MFENVRDKNLLKSNASSALKASKKINLNDISLVNNKYRGRKGLEYITKLCHSILSEDKKKF